MLKLKVFFVDDTSNADTYFHSDFLLSLICVPMLMCYGYNADTYLHTDKATIWWVRWIIHDKSNKYSFHRRLVSYGSMVRLFIIVFYLWIVHSTWLTKRYLNTYEMPTSIPTNTIEIATTCTTTHQKRYHYLWPPSSKPRHIASWQAHLATNTYPRPPSSHHHRQHDAWFWYRREQLYWMPTLVNQSGQH